MAETSDNNDLLTFAEDKIDKTSEERQVKPWRILVVDDDEQVHATTRIVLRHMQLLGQPIELFEARSAAETRQILPKLKDLAVIILDVVMESDDAGLTLVPWIRTELGLDEVRIILRTGQPGYAPELEIIERYDINDYKTKQELTHNRLITTLTAAVRGYQQIRTINHSRQGLQKIVQAASSLFETTALKNFADGVFTQIAGLLHLELEGLLCVSGAEYQQILIVGAAGSLAENINTPLATLKNNVILSSIERCYKASTHIFEHNQTLLFLNTGKHTAVIYLATSAPIDPVDQQLLEVFASNISIGYENLTLVQKLEYTAYFDNLTGLPNRKNFIRVLDEDTRHRREAMISCLLDIDHFADINDGLGQEVGNQVLSAVAERLVKCLEGCIVARVGPDVFGIYGPDTFVNPAKILPIFQESFRAGQYVLPLTVTLGFCRALENGEPGAWQMKFANIALNRAKKNLRDRYEYFKDEMEELMRWRIEVINKLRKSFEASSLELWYQPQVLVGGGKVCGIEALLRWKDETEGFIPPSVFIPLAEYSGLIIDIGYWVVDHASQALALIDQKGFTGLCMAVNVSVPQFRSADFVKRVEELIRTRPLDPSRLEIEITESIVMDEPKVVIQSLERLRADGFKIAIDDFGTGFSAMSYLQELPLDKLKIDKSFIDKIESDAGRAIVKTIISLCQTLGLQTIAEGVETAKQAKILEEIGCQQIQGYYYAKPMPLEELLVWLHERGAK